MLQTRSLNETELLYPRQSHYWIMRYTVLQINHFPLLVRELLAMHGAICEKISYKGFFASNNSNRSLVSPKKTFKHSSLGKNVFLTFWGGGFIGTQGVIGKKKFSDFYKIGVDLYVFWDEKLIGICQNSWKWPEITFLAIFWPKIAKNIDILAKKQNFQF